jgi:hypothetical protein
MNSQIASSFLKNNSIAVFYDATTEDNTINMAKNICIR